MTQSQWVEIVVALVLALVASLVAACEAALQHLSRSRAEELVEDGRRSSVRVHAMALEPARFVNSAMVVRIGSEVATIVLVCQALFPHLGSDWERILVVSATMLVVSYILWGVAPRTLGKQHDVAVCRLSGRIWMVTATLLRPLVAVFIAVGNAVTPGRGFAEGPFTTEAELRDMVDYAEASDLIEPDEREMIHSVFELGDTYLREVMVPRTDVVFIRQDKTLRQAMSLALRSGFSRMPVVGKSLDDILGIIYLKDLARRVQDNPDGQRQEKVSQVMREAVYVPDSKPIDDVLREMQRDRNHIVIVVDEFGGTAGLATIEDIVEEIVGEIVDEYDPEPTETEEIDPGVYRVSSRMPVDDLAELFDIKAAEEDVDTVGGLMAKELSVVPVPGASVVWEGIEITAEKATGRRHQVDTYLVRQVPAEPADEKDEDD
ncbi:hemolysin family protein [Acidipropionibacterium jensenii]|uniref:Magnesium and cobalt efflux protein CorC n=2 Tax=Acidipropionibacterium jensenii TaxID=1749 RepID=A0A448NWM7_9ACTN|nr:hemolysin family protein [Acidipropionibacterium jensenii]MDN5976872.1 hemolysin family protein [Acidipropionibacterium jensenii]MDN5996000.1 hemolysin family protein [Acidipropionibacterium jensenii]MDN6426828.1 hemolysin family protein [Acidipropionibacterium jensenii]MDN6440856.1 hemolysin family protein [Acidipropionibacterium jensenii]MDN6512142.1 hemolysin family protein [Acidipropionibacterium jensenii]